MNWIFILLVFCAGMVVSIQSAVNGLLGKKVGVLEGAFVSFLVGTIFLTVLLLFVRKGNLYAVVEIPKWQLIGGLLGGLYILTMILAVPKIGLATALTTLVAGQLFSGLLIDHFAIMGYKHIPISFNRIFALLLMAGAIYLMYKKD